MVINYVNKCSKAMVDQWKIMYGRKISLDSISLTTTTKEICGRNVYLG